ncbi:lytic transglycosylase domain-containing protein [Georgenia muralis]|uniref:LysM repeat protein n=1 Tax=Georgenia muralis TaxID=154117 RepID=A0A3N4Z9E7_9MICO|nr:lytic transglycosylase domain-containing protein [Georgenia muralis]RPF28664.1 LysM repeat protein [Georgenia muralis]
MKAEHRSQPSARAHAGRAGVGLALAATTAVGMAVPAAAAPAPSARPAPALHGALAAPVHVQPAAPVMTYRVQAGDTVSHIAARTGSSVGAIVGANGLDARAVIRVGQMLRIPSAAAAAPTATKPAAPAAAPAATTHTVRNGEYLSGIARQYGTSVSALVSLNSLASPDRIYVGQKLRVAGAAGTPTPTKPAAPAAAPAATTHTVRNGEYLSGIARQYGTSVSALVSLNSLASPDRIYVGQKLRVAGAAGTPTPPKPATPTPPKPAAPAAPAATTHTVVAGDTVSVLAARWGTTVAAVAQANKLGPAATIYVGQRLTVPAKASAAPAPTTQPLVPSSFLGRTYPEATVASANANKATLLATGVPSRAEMQALVASVARQMGVDPALAQAHAFQESGFNHASVSPANALGTMQVIPSSGRWASDLVGRPLNLLDPLDNVVAGVAIIRYHVRTAPDLDTAIASYYQGAGSVARNGLYPDTKMYVAAVRALMNRF